MDAATYDLCANSGDKCGESLRQGLCSDDCGGVLVGGHGHLSNQKEPTKRQLTNMRRGPNHGSRPLLVTSLSPPPPSLPPMRGRDE